MNARPRVVIVGGGFGGIECAKALRRAPCEVLLVDRRNHHTFQPLLYQVATAVLAPSDVGYPIRRIFRRDPHLTVALGEVVSIDVEARTLTIRGGSSLDEPPRTIRYDTLVLAAGANTFYFGHDEWSALAPSLKTLEDAVTIRARILEVFEMAEIVDDEAARRWLLTFVVVGGGPTGVELAGAIKELAVDALSRDFRRIDTTTA
ncbi:MAG: NAD(P)/FAD-dependent oxidoreductase, partial [Phycisphaerae bacterium]|nr:NAD(P)/FAD-dependent oxidoreductase [Phycisphaerae bacterium]